MKLTDISLERYKSGELCETIPLLEKLKSVIETDSVHNNDSVYNHTLNVAESIKQSVIENHLFYDYFSQFYKENSIIDLLITAAIFHDTGKVDTYTVTGNITSCEGHEEVSYKIISDIFNTVEGDESEKNLIKEIVRQHAVFYPFLDSGNKNIENDFNYFEKSLSLYNELLLFCISDIRASQLKDNDINTYSFKYNYLFSRLETSLRKKLKC